MPGPTAAISRTQRDWRTLAVDEHGRMNWRNASSYNKRPKGQAAIGGYKRVIADTMKSRHDDRRCDCRRGNQPNERIPARKFVRVA